MNKYFTFTLLFDRIVVKEDSELSISKMGDGI